MQNLRFGNRILYGTLIAFNSRHLYAEKDSTSIFQFPLRNIEGQEVTRSDFKDKSAILIVNVASK
jgi:hypothetical protein